MPDITWKSAALARTYTVAGNALAQLVANEIGAPFVIEFRRSEDGVEPQRFSASGPGTNPAAVAAFEALLAKRR